MRLFTPLAAVDADRAVRGALRGDFFWVDNPVPYEAPDDAVWVAIDVPDVRLPKFESSENQGRGYRAFRIPSRITNLHRAERVQLPI
ncbi:hypothetical protein [Conexibacter sp. S30A1]|jgi:hypothetical protein|uniref:hypothetical protein n=1 Tax=Conexibacter sp. S30A1 TaxID=2937800 RepID=UPI0020103EE8|nr:hypothetical protein [Conexibacter sp. S30A1]